MTCSERAKAEEEGEGEGEGGVVHDKVADDVEVAAMEHKAREARRISGVTMHPPKSLCSPRALATDPAPQIIRGFSN